MTVSFRRRFLWAILVPFQLVITGCFRDGPTEPPLGDVVLSLVSGDEQFGPASQFLIDALTVVVRREERAVNRYQRSWWIGRSPRGRARKLRNGRSRATLPALPASD